MTERAADLVEEGWHVGDEEILAARWFAPSRPPEPVAAWLERWVEAWAGRA